MNSEWKKHRYQTTNWQYNRSCTRMTNDNYLNKKNNNKNILENYFEYG